MALQLLMEIDIQMGNLLGILQTVQLLFDLWDSASDTTLVRSNSIVYVSNLKFTALHFCIFSRITVPTTEIQLSLLLFQHFGVGVLFKQKKDANILKKVIMEVLLLVFCATQVYHLKLKMGTKILKLTFYKLV